MPGLRSQIRPFPREAHYSTGWNGSMTFEEIREALTPKINRLMRYYRYVDVDIPDMITHGFGRMESKLRLYDLYLELKATFDRTMERQGAIIKGQAESIKFWRELAEGLMQENAALKARDALTSPEYHAYRFKDARKS